MIKVVAKNEYSPDTMDETLAVIGELVAETRKEEGCISYEFFKLNESENTYAFIETWESIEALDKHLNSEHYKRLIPKVREHRTVNHGIDVYNPVI